MASTAISAAERPAELPDERWVLCPTPEHLLLAILGHIEVVAALRACQVSEVVLADAVRARIAPRTGSRARVGTALSSWWRGPAKTLDAGVERVLTRSLIRAHASDQRRVTSADVLISLIDEPGCAAAELLREQGAKRYDVLNHVSHRIAKGAEPVVTSKPTSPWVRRGVVLHNDNYTPMDFVAHVLETIFDKHRDDALRVMTEVHRQGSAECGVFTYDGALAKVAAATDLGREHQFALRCVPTIKSVEREGAHAELLT